MQAKIRELIVYRYRKQINICLLFTLHLITMYINDKKALEK